MDPNAMNVDDPNSQYLTPFIRACNVAQTDDDTLGHVLHALAVAAAPNGSINVDHDIIKKLNMVDLRPRLASGQYAAVAHSVLERMSSSESIP